MRDQLSRNSIKLQGYKRYSPLFLPFSNSMKESLISQVNCGDWFVLCQLGFTNRLETTLGILGLNYLFIDIFLIFWVFLSFIYFNSCLIFVFRGFSSIMESKTDLIPPLEFQFSRNLGPNLHFYPLELVNTLTQIRKNIRVP